MRWKVLERDNFTCRYCGQKAPDAHLEVDHIIPVSEGGTDDEDNLTTACFACNRGKSALSIILKRPRRNGQSKGESNPLSWTNSPDTTRFKVFNLLKECGPLAIKTINSKLNISDANTRVAMSRLHKEDKVMKVDSLWTVKE